MKLKMFLQLRLFIFVFFLTFPIKGQGPRIDYYYHPATELPWAQCYVYQEGGSKQKIPFLPVIVYKYQRAPLGTNNYSKDINVNGFIVFIGNGIVANNTWDSYSGRRMDYSMGNINVAGKIVLFCYNFPDKIEERYGKNMPLVNRIKEAESRNAAAVVLFSHKNNPFLYVKFKKESEIPGIPVITITKKSALSILLSAGMDGETLFNKWEKAGKPPISTETISKLKIKIKGNFHKIETKNFFIRFRKEVLNPEDMKKIIQVNQKSLDFLLDFFKEDSGLTWEKTLMVYFGYFDSKLFYTRHWGLGWAGDEGIFNVYFRSIPAFGLAVHENTHRLMYLNWGSSSSFMDEGLAKYTEAQATNKDKNHLDTLKFLKEKKLFPIEKMVGFEIGQPGLETLVAYPSSGSFVEFLIKNYGLKSFKQAFIMEGYSPEEKDKDNTWKKVYGKSLTDLEKEWLDWLLKKFKSTLPNN